MASTLEWSRAEQRDITLMLKDKNIQFIVDIGANYGCATLHYLKYLNPAVIWAFEPLEDNFSMLSWNRDLGRNPKVVCINSGIYYGASSLPSFSGPEINPGGITVISGLPGTVQGEDMKMTELEEYFQDQTIDLIKIDVEGAEYNIIENSPTVKRARYLFVEWHNKSKEEIRAFVDKHLSNFQLMIEDSRGSYLLEQKN